MTSPNSSPETPVRAPRPSAGAERPQVVPTAEGWEQARTVEGRPLLQFASPRVKQPPVHLADLSLSERGNKLKEL
ncbi:MAG: 23S rRNA (adenine(2503)-C(2))-methyltransferase RlmN, partial [Actinomycetes bacterium]